MARIAAWLLLLLLLAPATAPAADNAAVVVGRLDGVVNPPAASYVERAIAQAETRGRNAEWAEQAVREAVNAPAEEALRLGVVDLLAGDLPALLRQLDGRAVSTPLGETTIVAAGRPIVRLEMQPQERLLHAL